MCTVLYQAQLISAKINLKVLVSEAVGASMKKMMKKEVKFSLCDNHWFTTLLMLSDVIHQVSHNKNIFTKILCPKILLKVATIDKGSRHLYSV